MYRKQVRRRRAVLALLIVSSFALLTATYGQQSGGLQRGVSAVFGPLQEGADRALKPARDTINWFDETFAARGDSKRLQQEVEQLRTKVAAGETALSENNQLRKLLGLRRAGELPLGFKPVTGRVIARSPTVWYSTVTIDHGTSAVSAKVVPSGIQGVIRPEVGNPSDLVLDFIDSSKHVQQGQTVVTSGWKARGLSSLYPYGIPLGRVTRATVAEQEASQQVHVRPFADLRELEFVQVLTK